MTEVDERIVAMHFDNKQFEKGAKETIDTLERLKESCDFEGSAESLNELGKAVKDLDFGNMAEKTHKLGDGLKGIVKSVFKFSTAPITKLGNALGGLANNVKKWFGIDLARDIEQSLTKAVKSLTVEPVAAGWDEYEMKMDSIKTIMSGTAKEFQNMSDEQHMGAVKRTLEELNHYADETIYSFKDMTASIGKFTNAGVKLDTAAKSMMGISNLAAQAGQGTQQASMAMYNFSQAMGLGYVELRDWRSIENANMATMEFKETLVELGVAMGTLKKDANGVVTTAVKGEKSVTVEAEKLRDTLQKKWLTTDVLSAALEIYSGDLSVSEIQRRFKVTEQQAQAYYKIGQEAKKAATQVRTFTKLWDALKESAQSGWAMSFEYIIGDMNEATNLWTEVNERISGWMEKAADDRNNVLKEWRGLTANAAGNTMKTGERDGREDLLQTMRNLFDVVEKIGQAIGKAWEDVFGKLTGRKLQKFTEGIMNFTGGISDWLGNMEDGSSRISKFSKILKGVFAVFKGFYKIIKQVADVVISLVLPLLDPIIDFLAVVGDAISDLVDGKFNFEGIYKSLQDFGKGIETSFDTVGSKIKAGWKKIADFFLGEQAFNIISGKNVRRKSQFSTMFEGLAASFSQAVTRFRQWIKVTWRKVTDFFLGEQAFDIISGKNVRRKSQFSTMFENLAASFNEGLESFKQWIHWDSIETFFLGEMSKTPDRLTGETYRMKSEFSKKMEKIPEIIGGFFSDMISVVTDFVKTEDGQPSKLSQWWTGIVSWIEGLKADVAEWEGWTGLKDWFNDYLVKPFGDLQQALLYDDEGNPTKLNQWWNGIKGWVDGIKETVSKWGVWTGISDWFNKNLIEPLRKVWNDLFGGGDEEKLTGGKKKAFNPIGVIASGVASDVSTLGKGKDGNLFTDSVGVLKQIKDSLTQAINDILGAFNLFDEEGNFDPIGRFKQWADEIGTKLEEAWKPVGDALTQVAADVKRISTDFSESVTTLVNWVVESPWDEWFAQLNEKMREFGTSLAILNSGSVVGGVAKAARGLGILGMDWGKALKKWSTKGFKFDFGEAAEGIKNFGTSVGEAAKSLAGTAGQWFSNPKELGKKIGSLFGGFREAQVTSTERVQTFANVLIELGVAVGLMAWAITGLIDKIKEINDMEGTIDGETKKSDAVWEKLDHLFVVIGSALGATEILAVVESKEGTHNAYSLMSSLIGFAGAIAAMTWALHALVELCGTATPKQIAGARLILLEFAGIITAFKILDNKSSEWIGSTDKNGTWKSGKTSAGGLIGFAVALEAMVLAVNQLVKTVKNTEFGEVQEAVLIITELTALISAFEVAKNWSTGLVGDSKAGTGLISFALALEAMLHATRQIAELTKDNDVDLGKTAALVAELAGLIAAFELVKNLSSIQFGEFKMGGGKTGLVGFAFAIEALVDAVRKLSLLKEDELARGTEALGKINGFIEGFVALKNLGSLIGSVIETKGGFKYNGGNNKSGLLGFVAAITAMLAEVVIIGNLPEDSVQNGLDVLGAVTLMVDSFVALSSLENFTEKFGSVGQKVAATVSLGVFIAGLAGILWAIAELSKTTTPDQVQSFTDVLSGIFPNLAVFETFITAMAALPNGSGWLGGAKAAINVLEFIAVFGAAAYGIAKWQQTNPELFTDIEEGVQGIGKIIGLFTGTIQGTHQGAALVTLSQHLSQIDTIDLDKMENLSQAVSIVKTMSENLPKDPTILEKWFEGKMSLGDFADNMQKLGEGIRTFYDAIGSDFNLSNVQAAVTAIGLMVDLVRAYGNNPLKYGEQESLVTFLGTMNYEDELGRFVNSKELLGYVNTIGRVFSEGFNGTSTGTPVTIDVTGLIESIALGIESATSQDRLRLAFAASIQGSINSLMDAGVTVSQAGEQATNRMVDGATQTIDEKAPEFAAEVEGFLSEMFGFLYPEATEGGKGMSEKMAEGAKTGASAMKNSGYYLDVGLANGISQYSYLPSNAMTRLTNNLIAIPRHTWQAGSPSRAFEDLGMYNMQGLAIGTENYSDLPISAVKQMSDKYYLAMQQVMAPIDAIVNDDFTFTPVIRPVVDMTNLQNGASYVNGMFANRYGINATLPAFGRNVAVPEVRTPAANNTQVINAITERMDIMSEELKNLKVVLDTGALVGGTVVAYDRALGRRASKARRG